MLTMIMNDDDLGPVPLSRTKSWKEYDGRKEIPMILHEGLLPIKFQGEEFQDLDYEGALRFYYSVDGQSELTKAVRLNNKTTVEELVTILVEKFSLLNDKVYELYEQPEEEDPVLLSFDECPLARAISTKKVPRFVLKLKESEEENITKEDHNLKKEKRKKLFSLSVGGNNKKDQDKKFKHGDEADKNEKPEKVKKSKKKKKSNKAPSNTDVNHNSEDEVLSDDVADESQQLVDTTDGRPSFDIESEIVPSEFVANDYSLPESFVEVDPAEAEEAYTDKLTHPLSPLTVQEDSINVSSEIVVESQPNSEAEKEKVHPDKVIEGEITEVRSRKLSFSNSSLFFDQDNDPPQFELKGDLKKVTKKSQKKEKADKNKLTQEKRSKSFSNMLKGQKKKQSDKDGQTELSTNKLTPGILKVFGDHVSKGSNYKAVRVSTISTAQEVVRIALERYGFENENPKDYVLCDVVGQFFPADSNSKSNKKQVKTKKVEKSSQEEDEQPQWKTEYMRAVHENEKPLVLQSLWKPTSGHSRRFELRRKVDVESSCFFINTTDKIGRRASQTSLFDDSDHSSVVSGNEGNAIIENKEFVPIPLSPHSRSSKLSGRQVGNDSNQAPLYVPYLLLLQGYKGSSDNIIHKLDEPTIIVGPYLEDDPKQCNITLYSSDILLPHCWIYKKVKVEEDSAETNLDEINFLVFIEPTNGADISVNGSPILTTTLLKPGQLVGFGKHYMFLFKDPSQSTSVQELLPWISNLKNNAENSAPVKEVGYAVPFKNNVIVTPKEDKAIQVEPLEPTVFSDNTEESEGVSDESSDEMEPAHGKLQAPRKVVNKSKLQLVYTVKDEEELLHTIIDIADENLGDFKMTPAYLFMMTIEHSAATFTEIQTRKLFLKISSGLQGIAWERTKEIGKQSSIKEDDAMVLLNRVLPELKPVLFWMASAIEMLNFLQCNIANFLLTRDKVTTHKEALLTADEELLTVLEEVIMFTFQQTVYHLTKVLYLALPSIIDVNPFQSEEAELENKDTKQITVHPAIEKITKIFGSILSAAKEYQVHPQIISQLFAYLFFFTNASMFNSLMERGPGGKTYRWTKGVQIRGNLDVFEDWAKSNGLSSQFSQYMARFIAAVNLLATPKVQLVQSGWEQLRKDFPILNAAQLQQLLAEYQLGGNPRPREWYPPAEEVEPALRSSEILESFATHPPLMLPSGNFTLDLNKSPDSKEFYKYLEMINTKFNPERLKDEPTTTSAETKSKKKRTKSNIDLEYVESAIQHAKAKANPEVKEAQVQAVQTSNVESQPQVGSIKSIQVQSKRTTITVTSRKVTGSTSSNDSTEATAVTNGVKENGVDDLIKQARVLINANDLTSDEEDDVDKNLSGNLNEDDDVFVVELQRGDKGLGLGLIDGMFTSLQNNGIYVRTIVPNTPAFENPKLRIGDQILAVNGTSLVGSDYARAMELIKKSGSKLSFLIAKSDEDTMNQVMTAST